VGLICDESADILLVRVMPFLSPLTTTLFDGLMAFLDNKIVGFGGKGGATIGLVPLVWFGGQISLLMFLTISMLFVVTPDFRL